MESTEPAGEHEETWELRTQAAVTPLLQLVLVWSDDEPHRVGESIVLNGRCLLGRGPPLSDDGAPRIDPSRIRPGSREQMAPWASARLGRQQLLLSSAGEDRVQVRNLGKSALRINGELVREGWAQEGDLVEVQNAAIWLVRCSPVTPRPPRFVERFPFGQPDPYGMVGESPAAWQLREALAFAARTDRHVLLLGDSGTGKELAARAIHGMSDRRGRPLVSRNAATLPESLIDAELFGNVKNYPNPGMPERPGLIGEADGGTLFLDEMGDLPESSQVHLLRVLDEHGEYQRLGEAVMRRSQFRLVAATNRPLASLKHDFLARFTHRVRVPALDERREDIPLVLECLLKRVSRRSPGITERFYARRLGTVAEPRISPALVARLVRHRYTLNVRELDRLLWLAIETARGDFLGLTPELEGELPPPPPAAAEVEPSSLDAATLARAMAEADGSPTRAAKALGLKNRYVLLRLLKKHGLATGGEGDA